MAEKFIYSVLIFSILSSSSLLAALFGLKLPVFRNISYFFYFCSSIIIIVTNSVVLFTLPGYPKTIQVFNWALIIIAALSTFSAHLFTILNLLNIVGHRPPQNPVLIVTLSSAFDTIILSCLSIVYASIQHRLYHEHQCILGPVEERREAWERASRDRRERF